MITGNIQNMQTLTGYIGNTGIKGIITKQNSQSSVKGYVQNRQTLTGHIKNVSGITGIITKKSSESSQSDHQFVIVDLVKLQAQMLAVSNVTAIVPFTAEATQTVSTQFSIHAVPTQVTVNQETASNVALTATNITVNEEVYTNVNA